MPIGHLWYVKRGEEKKGPFPAAVIERNIGLGRLKATDLISSDGETWEKAETYPDFAVLVKSAGSLRTRSRIEERQADRRARNADPMRASAEHRAGRDRRADEDAELVRRRERAQQIWQSLRSTRADSRRLWDGLILTLLLVALLSLLLGTPSTNKTADCGAAAGPHINWDLCQKPAMSLRQANLTGASLRNAVLVGSDLAAANLSDADLAYADLTTAKLKLAKLTRSRLTGATLRNADLSYADLSAADLEYADLTGADLTAANLKDAKLGNAIWRDGVVCRKESVGSCLKAAP